MIAKSETLMELLDSKGRLLVLLRRAPNGEVLTVMMRYGDMTDVDKNAVRGAFDEAASGQAVGGEYNQKIADIEKFLAFDDERPCG